MKKILFIWAVLFCIGTTAYGDPAVKSENANVLTGGVHEYTGTISLIALDGTATVYTGKTLKAEVKGDKVEFTLMRLPLSSILAVQAYIPNVTVDPVTGDIPRQSGIGVVVLYAGLTGNIYGNTLTDQSCDLVFDVQNTGADFLRFEFTGTATN